MGFSLQHLEKTLRPALQKDVRFMLNDKILREGKLLLFNIKDFYITFTIRTKTKLLTTYEIPVPYTVRSHNDVIIMDYALKHIHRNNDKTVLFFPIP